MVEIDSDTYQVKTMRVENKAVASRFLITPERSQNLALLQHLLANTHQAIVLCGPEGVGKTALLEFLQQRLQDQWRWCVANGHGEMTFEDVQDRLAPLLKQQRPEAPAKNTKQGHAQDAVLVIDDAGNMAPGLLTRFIHLAEEHQELHLLLVLTHDQWHIKNASDPAIENCYIVEARPLGPKECREFVQHIVALATSPRLGKGLSDDRIDAVYRESHGIPSRIMAHFPELNKPRESMDPLTILILAVAALVSLALYMQWHTASRPAEEITEATVQPRRSETQFDFRQPVLSLPVEDLLRNSQSPDLPGVQDPMRETRDLSGPTVASPQVELTPAAPPVLAPADKPLEEAGPAPDQGQGQGQSLHDAAQDAKAAPALAEAPAAPAGDGDQAESWLATRPENSYALQLMILSKASTVQAVITRHAQLQADLRVVRRLTKGKEKFVLLYGDFADAESAKNAKKSLPAEFRSAVIRKFGAIRKAFPQAPKPQP